MPQITKKNQYKKNPRVISDEELQQLKNHLEELGDLGGVVYCRNNKAYVGGNQRSKIFDGSDVTVIEEYDKPKQDKTLLYGFIEYKGNRYIYREVEFTKKEFEKACIVANNDGGTFDWDMLDDWDGDLLKEWGMELPDRYDIPFIDNEEAGSKKGTSNKYLNTTNLMMSVNRSTFNVLASDEEKRIIWDVLDEAVKLEEDKRVSEIIKSHLLAMTKQLKDEILLTETLSE